MIIIIIIRIIIMIISVVQFFITLLLYSITNFLHEEALKKKVNGPIQKQQPKVFYKKDFLENFVE